MGSDQVQRVLRSVRDRQVVGEALVSAILRIAAQSPPTIRDQLEALAIEAQILVQSNLSDVSSILADSLAHAA